MRRTRARRSGSNDFIDPCGKGYGYGYGYMDMIFFCHCHSRRTFCHFRHDIIVPGQYGWYTVYGMINLRSRLMLGPTYILVPKKKTWCMMYLCLHPVQSVICPSLLDGWMDGWQSSKRPLGPSSGRLGTIRFPFLYSSGETHPFKAPLVFVMRITLLGEGMEAAVRRFLTHAHPNTKDDGWMIYSLSP